MKLNKLTILAFAASLIINQAAMAESLLEEVTVTAQRKSESLQDVPVAVTAITESTIERSDIHDLTAIAQKTPSLSFAPFSPGQNIVTLRGISSNDDGAGTDNSVALFIDDVYLGRSSNINFEMGDLERVEVLRGPQGTLYGRNTIGGAISVITKKPSLDELYGKVKVTLGTYNRQDVGFLISVPFSDTVAMKFSAQQKTRDGWIKDEYQDSSNWANDNTENLANDNKTNYAMQLYYDDNEGVDLLFSFDANTLDVNDMGRFTLPYISESFADGNNAYYGDGRYQDICGGYSKGEKYCNASASDGFAKRDASGISLKVNAELDDTTTLTSITAMRSSLVDWEMDSVGGGNRLALIDNIYDETDQFSQEIRFSGEEDGYSYVVGLWYYTEETDRSEGFMFSNSAPAVCENVYNNYILSSQNGCYQDWYNQKNTTNSTAIFANFDIALTDNWNMQIGGRFTSDAKEITDFSVDGTPFPFIISPSGGAGVVWDGVSDCVQAHGCFTNTRDASWSDFSPKLVFNYLSDEGTNFYVSYARGFKSGGFPAAPSVPELAFDLKPEISNSYELGVKVDNEEGTARLNLTIYYNDYKDIQVAQFGAPSTTYADLYGFCSIQAGNCFGVFSTLNVAEAESQGLEVELQWAPVEAVFFNAALTLFRGQYTSDQELFTGVNIKDRDVLQSPRTKVDVGVAYIHAYDNSSTMTFSYDVYYQSDVHADLTNYYETQYEAYTLQNMKLLYTSSEEDYKVSLWVNNIFDESHVVHAYSVGPGPQGVYGSPRMSGVTVEYKF